MAAFSLYGVLAITFFLFLLQTNGATLGVGLSLVGYLGSSTLLVWSFLRHAVPHWASHHRIFSTIGAVVVCLAITTWGCLAQHHKEIRSRIPLTGAKLSSPTFNGKPQSPLLLSVSPPGATAEMEIEPQRNAGTYRAVVAGIGDYTGKIELEWTIQRRPLTVTAPSPNKVYDGSPLSIDAPTLVGLMEGDLVFAYSRPSFVGSEVGQFPIRVEIHPGTGAENYEIKTVDGLAKITGRDFSALLRDATYDGLRHRPEGFAIYPADADFTVVADEQSECGTYSATVLGRKNYQGTQKTLEWKILPLHPELTLGAVRGKDAAATSLLIPVGVLGINPTGEIFVSLFESSTASAALNTGALTLIGAKTGAVLKNGSAVIEYAVPPGAYPNWLLVKVEYPGDRNHEASAGQKVVARPTFILNSAADAIYHLRATLVELRQVYVADSVNATSTAAYKTVVELISHLAKEPTSLDRFRLSQAYPPIEPDMEHAIAGLEILRQLVKASSENPNLLGRYHAELANSFSDVEITLAYLRDLREAAKTDKKEPGYGPYYLQKFPGLCRELRTILGSILDDMEPAETNPNNLITVTDSIGTVKAGPLLISARNLQFFHGSRKNGRSNYATCVVEFTNGGSGDIRFAANGEPGDLGRLRCRLRAPNGTVFTAADFSGLTSVAVEADNPQPASIAWAVMHGHNADVTPGFFSFRRAVWLGRFSTLHAGQKSSATITFHPQDHADLYRDLVEGAEKPTVQFLGEFVVAAGGKPEELCEIFEAKIDNRIQFTETKPEATTNK